MSRFCRDVVIIGAGPTGLALAVALRQYGLGVTVLEKEPGTKRQVRASVLWQRALEILRDLGCAERFLDQGLTLRQAVFHVRGREIGRHAMTVPGTAFPQPLSIEQIAIEALLAERLRELGTEVRWNSEAVAVRPGERAAQVDVRGPDGTLETLDCRWVVGCEGAHSVVRGTLGLLFEGERRTGLQAVQINARPRWPYPYAPDTTYFFIERRASLIVSPRPGGGYRFFCFRDDPDPGHVAPPDVEEMRELVARVAHDPDVRLVPTEPEWFNRARFHDRVAATFRVGPALLAGDSAHLWAPVGGRGLNTGLRGIHNLAWKLAAVHQGHARDALLDTYTAEQRAIAREVMRQMRRNVLELPPSVPTLTAMRLLGPALLRSETFNRQGRNLLSELFRHYRAGPLAADRGGRGALRAGDRLPDLPVTESGRQRRLHDLLSYERWTLLVGAASGAATTGTVPGLIDTAEVRRVLDRYAVRAEVFGIRAGKGVAEGPAPGTLLLVRPDGHIGLRARAGDVRALDAYLGSWFVRRGG
ncbi:FAD-dependent oxidoreductase [Streptomyces sp. NPDC000405]|uniref:FAD-dependent oxidoreductase n=1 Tax=Streptomyces sp. NPDC000405 TaxID=3161033 RepID=UPI00398D2681